MKRILFCLGILLSRPAIAALDVFACEPEWAALAQEIGGDQVSTFAATTARQDPHRIEARPSLIARMRRADLAICTGAELEVGWLPLLLTQSGNPRVQRGAAGYFEASQFVDRLEVPKVLDRAMGDVHPSGNPHIHLDPRNIGKVGAALALRLADIDRGNAELYRARAAQFGERWRAAIARWEREAAPLKGMPVVVYHKDFSYFLHWTGMREAGALEPKPGIPPTPAHLAELVERMQRAPAKVIIHSAYSSPKPAEFLSERTHIPAVMMPFTVGGTDRARDLYGLFDDTIERLLKAAK
ncbi:MAG TPA: zinc ABC transporter substrate-binding protein [Burkholderiales bacterium]|jgi:zinc/manganese transport system substrate-binding protein|nr:zinc ABC transporter substrate-binding protein [Burkholderiales bacterium]